MLERYLAPKIFPSYDNVISLRLLPDIHKWMDFFLLRTCTSAKASYIKTCFICLLGRMLWIILLLIEF